ncbi:sugar ABC transporter substrate-binding protein [Fictibacillus fluitans]|uniref:Sugar ABC transporter substrate-binding protein n=1 Tax=Fictibacillus fluitans TaxID=3058422 RepID=A0ABT8HZW7_9BACL|nr:sugar ABC transporter substrate-binding protein [Fictibacillus sp. NE201]MDN4525827.1 sugar ABC transporter substrate-binding protein [Fictibacillus sp. NE201]
MKNWLPKLNKKMIVGSLAGTLLLTGALTGCSSGSSNSDKTVINVWGMGEEAKSLPKIAEAFEKENPKIDVKVQAIPWETAHDKLLTAVAAKKGPDVVQMGTTWIPEFGSAKALLDLKPYMKKYPELDPSNYYEGSVETTKYKDQTVGVPWYIDTRVLFYRTDLLKKAGYSEAPKTWEELSAAAKKLADRGDNKYGISLDTKEQSLGFMFARQNGAELLDSQGKPHFNDPKFVEAVDYLNSFFKNGSAPKDSGIDIVQGFRGEGMLPMFISGPWMVKLINDQAPDLKGKWATAVLPKKENNLSSLGGSNLSVFKYTKQKDASLKFLSFMSKPETQLKWMKMTNSLPSAKKAWEDKSLKENKFYTTFGEQMKDSKPMPVIKQWEPIAQAYLSSFEKIYRGKTTAKKEMDVFNKKSEELLNK